MQIQDADRLMRSKMAEHGLHDWSFRFDKSVRRFGVCKYRQKLLQLSKALTELNEEEEVLDTILHEIAHAIAGHKAGHGPKWQKIAKEIGARPIRCYDHHTVKTPPAKFIGECPAGHTIKKNRRMRSSCAKCSPRFDTQHLFTWSRNDEAK